MKTEPFDKLSDAQIMAICIYGEARGESTEGKIAVASVIIERFRRGGWYGKTIRDVILKPYQFSCFLPADPNYGKLVHIADQWDEAIAQDMVLCDCYGIAAGILNGNITPNIEATHYKTGAVNPEWAEKLAFVGEIGHHQFYAEA